MNIELDLGKVGVTHGGTWNATASYERLTVVLHDGSSYISLISNVGVTPGTNGNIWQLVASKGENGSGSSGDSGSGSGSGGGGSTSGDTIGVAYYSDGYLYWTKNGDWLLGPDGNMVRAQGIDGKDGSDGSGDGSYTSSFKSIVFIRSNERPDTPTDGTFTNPVPTGWSDGIPTGEAKLWMSTRWFYSDESVTARTTWSTPAQATDTADVDFEFSSIVSPGNPTTNPAFWHNSGTSIDIWMAVRIKKNGVWDDWSIMKIKGENGTDGKDGKDGKDGTSVNVKGSLESTDNLPTTGNAVGDTYIINGDLWVWDGDSWENCGQLKGDPGQSQYIHIAYSNDGGLTLTLNNGTDVGRYFGYCVTTNSTRPLDTASYIWAKFQGEDGFGYEYIYKTTSGATAPDVPESSNEDEYVPTGWSDDPLDVSAESPYCWMCSRIKKNGIWGNYMGSADNEGKAALFAKYGRDGVNGRDGIDGVSPNTSFKSIVFKRSNSTPDTPTGGSYASPVPEGWSDGIPTGEAKLWMSTRILSSDGEAPQQSAWTAPVAVTDTEYMDYEYSSVESPGTPSKDTPAGAERNANWSDNADTTTIWMAMREVSNGEYASGSDWKIMRIKGEDGKDGTGISIKGTVASSSALPTTGNTAGDAYMIGGDLWIWDGDSWENVGRIQGTPGADGQTPYLHIKYSNDGGLSFTANDGETPGDYIGMYWDYNAADSANVDSYKPWRMWKGEDGFGYEYIFKLTATSTAPAVPSDVSQVDDYVPSGWTDNPGNVTKDTPYCWVCYRKKTDGVWGAFIGSSTNSGKAGLFSHYGRDGIDGRGISGIVEMYAVNNSPTVAPTSWKVTVPELTSANKYLWNYEIINYTNGDSITTMPCVIGTYGTGRGISSIVEYYLATASSNGITRNTSGWTTAVQSPTISKPFLWNYESITYDDGTTEYTDPVVIGHYGSDGADGEPGVGVSSVTEHFLASASATGVTKNTYGWTTGVQAMTDAKPYLWNYETITYTDGNTQDTQPHIIGHFGADGNDGRGISSVTNYYLATALTTVTRSTSGWTTTPQTISVDKPYLWNYERITFTDGTTSDTDPVIIGVFGVSSQDDLSYLEDVFGPDNVSGQSGALVRNLLGVTDSSNKVVAMINGSSIGESTTHGKLFIAAGLNGVATAAGISKAKFKVYEDGTTELVDLVAVNATLSGTINAVGGTVGPFSIDEYNALTSTYTATELSGSLQLSGGFLRYVVSGNGYGGEIIIGYRNANDSALVTLKPTQEDPGLKIIGTGGDGGPCGIRLEQGASIQLGDSATSIKLYDGAYIEAVDGMFKGFRTPIVTNSTAYASVSMGIDGHTFLAWANGITYNLPASPAAGDEFDIIIVADKNVYLSLNGKAAMQIYGGERVEHTENSTLILSPKYHYRMWYNGTCWIITRN